MIAEIFPEAYDAHGTRVARPDSRIKGMTSAPMRRYLSQPLTVQCSSIFDIRTFLKTCKYVSDEEQFGKKDYWQPPEDFECSKSGDCDCFALWAWRQLLALGFDSRFVIGRAGRYGESHAWVQFAKDGSCFVLEPTAARLGNTLPRLSALRYRPRYSVGWDGTNLSFYTHNKRRAEPPFGKMAACVPDWLIFWTWYWIMVLIMLPLLFYRRIFRANPVAATSETDH